MPNGSPDRRATDTPIHPLASSQVNVSMLVIASGLYSLWRVIESVRVKAPFDAVDMHDFLNIVAMLAQIGGGGFWLWKRVFAPQNRPIIPGPVINSVARITGTTSTGG